jgi:hypothetical protein
LGSDDRVASAILALDRMKPALLIIDIVHSAMLRSLAIDTLVLCGCSTTSSIVETFFMLSFTKK